LATKKINKRELKALVSLLDDDDAVVLSHVEEKILSLGHAVIPQLESHWESTFNPIIQKRLEDLIHSMQFNRLQYRLTKWKSSKEQDLLEGLWMVATYLYPDLELVKLRNDLEQIFYDVWLEFKSDARPYDQVKILNSVLFDKLKFKPNSKNFHSIANSMINQVIETKKGNPLTLSAIYMLVAQKLKMPVYGVNLPNLFILVFKLKDQQFYINAFNRGIIFTREDIDNYIAHLNLTPIDMFFEPCTNKDAVRRLLRNLMVSFDKIGDHEKSEEIKILLKAITEGNELDY
jgi:regulator of sirC expression with transglutaminase-like and TPR domain